MKLKPYVEQSGKTREQICQEAGISRAFLSLLEAGERSVGPGKVVALANALGVKPQELRPDMVAIWSFPSSDTAPASGRSA